MVFISSNCVVKEITRGRKRARSTGSKTEEKEINTDLYRKYYRHEGITPAPTTLRIKRRKVNH